MIGKFREYLFSHRIRRNSNLLIVAVVLLCAACAPDKRYAPYRNFYFKVVVRNNNEFLKKLGEDIELEISNHDYTITNNSGLRWPFYKELDKDENILSDSLMPPHWFVHRMIPYKEKQIIGPEEYLVSIELMSKSDTIPNYAVEIFRMDSTGLTLSGLSGVHYIDSTEFSSNEDLSKIFLRSVIRYSFK
ncbi:hypothetical protein WSM22_20160 [Cytophagales bacterium WSM2-2]|nr:hypothetical protein WSM22_20160 [Cytophagales bacterium WSM2-2]